MKSATADLVYRVIYLIDTFVNSGCPCMPSILIVALVPIHCSISPCGSWPLSVTSIYFCHFY